MYFLAEMEVADERVLEEMDNEEADKDVEERSVAGQADGLWDDLEESHGKHVAGAEREKGMEHAAGPVAIDNKVPAEEISAGCNDAECSGERGPEGQFVIHQPHRRNAVPPLSLSNNRLRT